jgi:hypothetical protein
VKLEWRAPTDTTGLMGYDVYRNGSFIAQVRGATTTTYQDLVMPLAPETYTVAAVDNAGNVSAESAPASATPPACFALGVVHPPNDGCTAFLARPGFVANWWDKGQSPASLQATVSSEQACGQMEVPLFWTKPDWATTSSKITAAMTTYFQQNPTVPLWQFGWEENAHGRCCTSTQLTTIAQELAAVAAARTAAGLPGARLAYQIVFGMGNAYDGTGTSITTGSSLGDLEAFFASTAPTNLDTIAVHPYAWNNFPTPETWEPQSLAMLRGYIRNSVNPAVDIVYTEGGAPVCDTSPAGCTLDEYGTPVRGQGQEENAEFMVKHHVLALAAGVTKVLWYQQGYSPDPVCTTATSSNNCGSSGAKAGCAESCFGMVNAQGPRLVAGAYGTLTGCLAGKGSWPVQASLATGVQAYDFGGPGGHCVIAWTYLAGTTEIVQPTQPSVTVTLDTLTGGRPPTNVQTTTGGAIPFTDGSTTITLTPAPVFIETD